MIRRLAATAALSAAFLLVQPVGARLPPPPMADTPLADPAREAEAKTLMESIRCLVCEGQSIADSEASMAADMRALVRERMAAGESADAVRDWLVARYGGAVSYRPPFEGGAALLWLAPLVVLAGGIAIAWPRFRKRRP